MGRSSGLFIAGVCGFILLLVVYHVTWCTKQERVTIIHDALPTNPKIPTEVVTKTPETQKIVQKPVHNMHYNANNFSKTRLTAMMHCVTGHILNLPPICGSDGCLRTLPNRKVGVHDVQDMPEVTRGHVDTIKGWVSPIHIDVVWYLTKAQRHFGIWGSVGEIGVYNGQYTGVLAHWLDVEAGERLFICDIFGKEKHMILRTENANKVAFEENMLKFGFSMYSKNEKRLIRVWEDSSVYLSKSVFLDMDMPSFRLFSIDGNHNKPFILLDLLTVSCIIRDGGIIAADDAGNPNWPDVRASIKQYFTHFGVDIFRPLLLVNGKLYLVTENWHGKYMEWLEYHGVPAKLKLWKQSDDDFGPYFSYYRT